MMEVLRLEPDPETYTIHETHIGGVKFYDSSRSHGETNEPLLAILSKKDGMRLTIKQVQELRNYLNDWLDEVYGV
jgi:hypothetical protein